MFALGIFLMVTPCLCVKKYANTSAFSIITTAGWFFFVLINAYYGGALTMFFTSEIRVPFTSIEDVMRAYPNWQLKMMSGNDVHFQYKAIQVS